MSILMPSRNGEEFLEPALASLRGLPSTEVLVQDAGSTDRTPEILAAERRRNPRLSVCSEPDAGQADALNRALARARGRYIGWLNADDFYFGDGIQSVLEVAARTDAAPDVIYGDFAIVDARGHLLRRYASRGWRQQRFFTHGCYVFSGATFWRADVLRRLRFDSGLRYTMDLDLFLRAGDLTTVHVPAPVAALRVHASSKTGNQPFRFATEALTVRRRWAQDDRRLRALAYWIHLKSVITIAAQPLRMSRAYACVRSRKTL